MRGQHVGTERKQPGSAPDIDGEARYKRARTIDLSAIALDQHPASSVSETDRRQQTTIKGFSCVLLFEPSSENSRSMVQTSPVSIKRQKHLIARRTTRCSAF